ncbi:Calx-beta domain-containing protein [uncultured Eudoraea sp.]|uniref:Calx-beta domain-containing protein n=1 Tax=uncultured Eudoraea sp. TaxID=1035614 RepID=UPI0026161FFE|nr:Calx-beta domain-containing protein [uncultured Eudoraea sp.]
MKNIYLKNILGLTIALLTLASCNEDDLQNASTMVPTEPTGSVSLGFSNPTTIIEGDETFDFTVSLSETQIVDVKVFLSQTGGTATEGEDFTMPGSILIPANTLSATGTITILSDELAEGPETAIITIGSGNQTANASFTSTTVTFNILNLASGDLATGLSWEASEPVFDESGNEIDPTDLADLRFLLTDVPYTTIIDGADGGAFETLVITEDTPDGEYYLVADFFAAADFSRDLDLTVTLAQAGVSEEETYFFPAALNTDLTCAASNVILVKLTKTGSTYDVEYVGESSAFTQDISGTYDVVSNGVAQDSGPVNNPLVNFASTATITDNGDGTFTLSDGWAGVYIDWYSIYGNTEPEPQVLTVDVCAGISASWTDIFGGGQTLTGTVNTDGTLTIRIDNVYGDFVDAVYTPQ